MGGNQPTTAFSDQFNQNKNQQVYFNLSIPVFNKLQVKSNVEIAKLNKINADLEKEKTVNNLVTALKAIKIQYQNSEEKYRLLQQNFENQKLSFEKSEEKYKEGLMDAYTFFVVRNNWLQANFNLIKSRYDVMLQEKYSHKNFGKYITDKSSVISILSEVKLLLILSGFLNLKK